MVLKLFDVVIMATCAVRFGAGGSEAGQLVPICRSWVVGRPIELCGAGAGFMGTGWNERLISMPLMPEVVSKDPKEALAALANSLIR